MRYVVPASEIEWTAVRAQGPGGQNVNKVSSAVHLRFDLQKSSMPEAIKQRIFASADRRLTDSGVIVIKAQASRSQEKNRIEAIERLQEMVDAASVVPIVRKATKPTYGSKLRRLESKGIRSQVKAQRGKTVE